MKINEIRCIRYDFDEHEKVSYANSRGMNAMFEILHHFRLNVKL